jgi:hypothetical protein
MSDDEKHVQRTITLESSSNHAAWRLSLANYLLGRELLDYFTGNELEKSGETKAICAIAIDEDTGRG